MKSLSLLLTLLWVSPSHATLPSPVDPCPAAECRVDMPVGKVDLRMHNREAQGVLNKVLADQAFWADASVSSYKNQLYDEIRLKKTGSGYVPMITGQGDEDFPEEVVADIVFRRNVDLPRFMSGAEAMVRLGSGYDSTVGAEYHDSFYLLDFTLFYGHFMQRMYKRYDEEKKQHVMWFEKLDQSYVGGERWQAYQAKVASVLEGHDRRWLFNGYEEVTDIYGMFVVTPGETRQARVTFVSKVTFGEDAGWVAQAGSKMPAVIRSGLKAGFDGCVAIAKDEKKRRIAAGTL